MLRQTSQMRLRHLVEPANNLIESIQAEIVGLPQGFEPTMNLVDSLKGIGRQFSQYALELPGFAQGMIRSRRKEIQHREPFSTGPSRQLSDSEQILSAGV